MKSIPLILIGCGGVGRQLLHHIVSCRSLHAKQGVCLRVVGVCDSKSLLLASDMFTMELDDAFLMEVYRVKSNGSSLLTLSNFGEYQVHSSPEAIRKVTDIAASLGRSTGLTFVDCSASSETIAVLNQVIDLGCCIVLANKRPLSSSVEDFDRLLSQPRRIRHESTVGAGLPVIASLNRILSSGDPVYRIIGSLSGTLGYVMSEVEDGKLFSEVVKAAKTLGYTEPDPRDDLSGMDVARKVYSVWVYPCCYGIEVIGVLARNSAGNRLQSSCLRTSAAAPVSRFRKALILARLLGYRINLDSIKIESLYLQNMAPNVMPVEDFLVNGLPLLDKDIQDRVTMASSNGNALRYVCMIEDSRCEVGIQELPKDSALGRLRGSDNVLEIYSRCYQQPLVIQGAGAGIDTTAAGVLADILDMQDLFP